MTQNSLSLPAARSPSPAKLHGWRLTLARVIWAVGASFAIAVFIAFIPINWYGVRNHWLVGSAYFAVQGYIPRTVFVNYTLALHYFACVVSLGVAALIVWRKSDDAVALMVALGLMLLPIAIVFGGDEGRIYALYGRPWHKILQTIRDWLAFFAIHYMVFLFFIFPNGRFAPRWMKWAAWGVLVIFGIFLGLSYGWTSWEVWFTTFTAWLVLAVGSQIYRYLRVSGPTERQQTKWFVVATMFGPLYLLIGWVGLAPGLSEAQANLIGLHLQYAWLLFLALGVGIGVLRRGLWGADPIINRTLVFGGLTLLVLTLYGAIVFGLGAAFGGSGNVLLAVIATGVIAIAFNPLRQRLQRAVNRLMYGDRDDPATVLARLGQRLETAIAPETTLTTIAETVVQTLKVPYAAIELTTDDGSTRPTTVEHPALVARPSSVVGFPLIYQSEPLGHLLVAPRAPGEAFSTADRRLLEQIAQQAAPAVHAYRLTADLQQSRERIVTAREEERRRLRRDLHDGLGPTLASQALRLEAALDTFELDPAAARAQLGELKTQTQALVSDVRRIVYDLRPPVLDELGLTSAVREHARRVINPSSDLRVTIEAPETLPPLSAAVEVAAYRIVLEALTNVVKHAQAHKCGICLAVVEWRQQKFLTLEIMDDGIGLPATNPPGVGFASMRERAEELGGTCVINNGQPGGVKVLAQLPITVH